LAKRPKTIILCKQMAGTLNDLFKATSRSFYLNPPCGMLLPAAVRPQISSAGGAAENSPR
jgi:hypothetical protein